jgi:probable F420-dependent oxidoreductase
MKVGLWMPRPVSRDDLDVLLAFVANADERGVASAWAGEHAVCFDRPESFYPYSQDNRWDFGIEELWLEPFVFLSYLAANTRHIRLGTGIVLVPQRNPVYTAKSVGTLDFLSRGRLDFGVGLGWSKEEFEALQVPWDGRAQRTSEYLEVMKALWSEGPASYEGESYTLPPSYQRPLPAQRPHPPIFFGGETEPALKRVAELGDGWFGWPTPDEAAPRVARLRDLIADRGREPGSVHVAVGCPWPEAGGAIDRDALSTYRAAGVDQVLVAWPGAPTAAEAIASLDAMLAYTDGLLDLPAVS